MATCDRRLEEFHKEYDTIYAAETVTLHNIEYPIFLFSGVFGTLFCSLVLYKLIVSKAGVTAIVVIFLQLCDSAILLALSSVLVFYRNNGPLDI